MGRGRQRGVVCVGFIGCVQGPLGCDWIDRGADAYAELNDQR